MSFMDTHTLEKQQSTINLLLRITVAMVTETKDGRKAKYLRLSQLERFTSMYKDRYQR